MTRQEFETYTKEFCEDVIKRLPPKVGLVIFVAGYSGDISGCVHYGSNLNREASNEMLLDWLYRENALEDGMPPRVREIMAAASHFIETVAEAAGFAIPPDGMFDPEEFIQHCKNLHSRAASVPQETPSVH